MAQQLTLARPYARALFSLAEKNNQTSEWLVVLHDLGLVLGSADALKLINNPDLDNEQIVTIFRTLVKTDMDKLMTNFLRLLANNSRIDLLPDIHEIFFELYTKEKNKKNVELTSAVAMSDTEKASFSSAMKNKLNAEINLICKEDPTLIAGAIVKVGDKVIDGSIKGKLAQMAEAIGA